MFESVRLTISSVRTMRHLSLCLIFASALWHATARGQEPENLQTFLIEERFGVSHPLQIVDFDVSVDVEPEKMNLVTGAGEPTVFQFLEGGKKVAVATDLDAHGSRRWHLRRGPPPTSVQAPLHVTEEGDRYQIVNGLTGIRVPKPVQTPVRPIKISGEKSPRFVVPCPVQGVLLRDGQWMANGPNLLQIDATQITNMKVRFLEKGPLKIVVQVRYDAAADAYQYGTVLVRPAGPGYYQSTITVQADQPSILFEEETDLDVDWSIDVYGGVSPTHGRYRGNSASKQGYGYEPGGLTYRGAHARPPLDAQVDLDFVRPRKSWHTTNDDNFALMRAWNRWARDTGWYWQLFNMQAPESANLVGAFVGRASLALEAGFTGTGVFTKPADPGKKQPQAGFSFASHRRGPDMSLYKQSRYHWGLFVGTKRDLLPPDQVQPINKQMNLHGGFNLNKISRYEWDFSDPPGGYGVLYMEKERVEALKKKLRSDRLGPNGKGFHGYLYKAEPTSRPLIDLWKDPRGVKLQAAIAAVHKTAQDMLEDFVNRDGIYSPNFGYWHGGLAMMRNGIWIDEILANPQTTPEQRRQIKASAMLFGNVLWDNDFVPMDNHSGINLGTANMPVQQTGYRRFYALLLASHPSMVERAKSVEHDALRTVQTIINESGAEIGCPHYVGASFVPTLNTLLQLKQRGFRDPFETEPRLAKFAEFYMNLLTPPEPRVGKKRVLIALGDGSIEPSETLGVLATGLRDADPKLSARLMGAWHANGKPHSGFFGTTVLMIDDGSPTADPDLGDADFPGYYSVLRNGWGTSNETALWFVNGDFYRDHRHNDHGSLAIYALGQPLSVNWSGLYTPQTPGAYMHSAVVLEKNIGHDWDQDGCSLAAGGRWHNSRREAFISYPEGAYSRAQFEAEKEQTTWTRAITVVRANPAVPLFLIQDTFAGDGAHEPKIQTTNFLAKGAVKWHEGSLSPTRRTHPASEHRPGMELPSANAVLEFEKGINQLGFTGRYPIDWDVFVLAPESQQGLIGNWAVTPHGNEIKDREERQHILRVRGRESFCTLIVVWQRGKRPTDLAVRVEGERLIATAGGKTVQFLPKGYTLRKDGQALERPYAVNDGE